MTPSGSSCGRASGSAGPATARLPGPASAIPRRPIWSMAERRRFSRSGAVGCGSGMGTAGSSGSRSTTRSSAISTMRTARPCMRRRAAPPGAADRGARHRGCCRPRAVPCRDQPGQGGVPAADRRLRGAHRASRRASRERRRCAGGARDRPRCNPGRGPGSVRQVGGGLARAQATRRGDERHPLLPSRYREVMARAAGCRRSRTCRRTCAISSTGCWRSTQSILPTTGRCGISSSGYESTGGAGRSSAGRRRHKRAPWRNFPGTEPGARMGRRCWRRVGSGSRRTAKRRAISGAWGAWSSRARSRRSNARGSSTMPGGSNAIGGSFASAPPATAFRNS